MLPQSASTSFEPSECKQYFTVLLIEGQSTCNPLNCSLPMLSWRLRAPGGLYNVWRQFLKAYSTVSKCPTWTCPMCFYPTMLDEEENSILSVSFHLAYVTLWPRDPVLILIRPILLALLQLFSSRGIQSSFATILVCLASRSNRNSQETHCSLLHEFIHYAIMTGCCLLRAS